MKKIVIALAVISLGSFGYAMVQRSQAGLLREELVEARSQVAKFAMENQRLEAIAKEQRAVAEKMAVESRTIVVKYEELLSECEKRRRK